MADLKSTQDANSGSLHSKLFGDPKDKIDIAAIPEMSADEIDSLLQVEAPEFAKEVGDIGQDTSLTLEQIIIDDADAALHAEIDLWASYTGPRKWAYKVLPFLPKVSLKL